MSRTGQYEGAHRAHQVPAVTMPTLRDVADKPMPAACALTGHCHAVAGGLDGGGDNAAAGLL